MPKEFKCPNSGYDCGYPACAHADQCRKHPVAVQTYTIAEIADYIAGWSMASYEEVKKVGAATLSNALSQLEDDQDGIEAVRQRKIHSERRCEARRRGRAPNLVRDVHRRRLHNLVHPLTNNLKTPIK